MSLLITEKCINCDMCLPECPNEAISMGDFIYQIDPDRCTECVGHYPHPTCISVCPIDGAVIRNLQHQESPQQLQQKFERLQAEKSGDC